MDNLAQLVVGAVIGGAVTLAVGFVSAWVGRRNEHDKWLREQRLDAYVDALEMFHLLELERDASGKPSEPQLEIISRIAARIRILGPDTLRDASAKLTDTLLDDTESDTSQLRQEFIEIAQKTLNIRI